MDHKFPYKWKLSDGYPAKGIDYHGSKVFSCFACGGGSTMGYKLAGYDVIGMNEIDPKMAEVYIENHHPKYAFIEPIQDFVKRETYPDELYNLDILDGSPPCSSFSMAGNREKDWGKEKKFREGQAEQVLDTLFFYFIELGKKLQPKVIIAENVKGLLQGDAKSYVKRIMQAFQDAGYKADYKLLDASKMGVPQKRERVFFYAIRNDLKYDAIDMFGDQPRLNLEFNEDVIVFNSVSDGSGTELSNLYHKRWLQRSPNDTSFADITKRLEGVEKCFSDVLVHHNRVSPTITSKGFMVDFETGLRLSDKCLSLIGSYPMDYKANVKMAYLIGMSVPPVMMAQIAHQVYLQWLMVNGSLKESECE